VRAQVRLRYGDVAEERKTAIKEMDNANHEYHQNFEWDIPTIDDPSYHKLYIEVYDYDDPSSEKDGKLIAKHEENIDRWLANRGFEGYVELPLPWWHRWLPRSRWLLKRKQQVQLVVTVEWEAAHTNRGTDSSRARTANVQAKDATTKPTRSSLPDYLFDEDTLKLLKRAYEKDDINEDKK
jgi:hypothetical protein